MPDPRNEAPVFDPKLAKLEFQGLPTTDCLTDRDIDMLVLAQADGEVTPPAHVGDCEDCGTRVRLAFEAQARFLAEFEPRTRPALIEALDPPKRTAAWLRWLMPAMVGAAAMAAVVLLVPTQPELATEGTLTAATAKGAASARVVAVRAGRSFDPMPGNPAAENDALRFAPNAPGYGWATVLEMGSGRAEPVLAAGDASSFPVGARGAFLPGSFVLDGSGGPERFLLVVSKARIDDSRARQIAQGHSQGGAAPDGTWLAVPIEVPKQGSR